MPCRWTAGRIEIRGFGSFGLHQHAPRIAHNPKTGDPINSSAKAVVHFNQVRRCENV
ncbi:MAG: HU family DNA-binding protein [Methylococcaceae bacterium]